MGLEMMKSPRFMLFWIPATFFCLSLVILALSDARNQAERRKRQCQNNIRNIALAIYNYASGNDGYFPPAAICDENGKAMHSWRVLILPYIDEQDIYDRYDFTEPWNGPNNTNLHDDMPSVFTCYEADRPDQMTGYMVITDPGGIFNGSTSTNIDDIYDGASQTLLLVEIQNQSTHWLSPVDATNDEFKKDLRFAANNFAVHKGGTNVCFAAGRVKFLSESVDDKTLDALISIHGSDPLPDSDY